ncbi:hypothetical protein [Lysobacter panacisoli]|uniref:Uncharacterized protein n=1 Tax=Lysobacter panacisoli TaxID=1255263 RepID=A0ABP9LSD4_9GAMM|nr:hypothetical protein [Lysobacter panacisoli]
MNQNTGTERVTDAQWAELEEAINRVQALLQPIMSLVEEDADGIPAIEDLTDDEADGLTPS